MTINCLCFEAKSIQDYLLQSGRLRDVIGASELVDSLTGELLDQAIEQLELRVPEDVAFFPAGWRCLLCLQSQQQRFWTI